MVITTARVVAPPRTLTTVLAKRIARAYLLGHITHTGPRLVRVLLHVYARRTSIKAGVAKAIQVLESSLAYTKFPAFCAILLGLYTSLEEIYFRVAQLLSSGIVERRSGPSQQLLLRICRIAAGLTASSLSFRLLNSSGRASNHQGQVTEPQDSPASDRKDVDISQIPLAGRTLDFTLLVTIRAAEALIGGAWRKIRQPKTRKTLRTTIESVIGRLADPAVFAASAGMVMWAWFYYPERLPRAYQKWIGEAAQVDEGLVLALRNARNGKFNYGGEAGQAPYLEKMCRKYNWPLQWGDPAKTIPVPCEMVHMGTGTSCHYHGFSRFMKAFQFGLAMYLPIQLVVKMRRPSAWAFVTAIQEAARSSGFLGAFIGLFYYFVCLSRTLVGPKLLGRDTATRQMIDSGLCVGAGCAACGLSIALENPRRHGELAFFVAPRAAATFLPRRYDRKYLWREQVAFSVGAATLFAMVEEDPNAARGLVSFVLSKILA